MAQTVLTVTSTGTIDPAQITQIITENLQPVNQEIQTRAKAIDENLLELSATTGVTSFKHDRQRTSRVVFLGINTTFAPTAPDNGWTHGDLGEIIVYHQADNLTVNVIGIADPNTYSSAPATQKATGSKWVFQYRMVDGDLDWEFKRVNKAAAAVAKRYFVKGNGATAHIAVPTHTDATPKVPLISNDTGTVAYLWKFRANELEKTGKAEVLFSKGAGSSGTSQALISSAGLLSIGMGNAVEERITFPDSVFDNEIHYCGHSYKPGTTNNGFLKAALDGTIETRADIPNQAYNTSPFNFLSLGNITDPFGTNAKLYEWYMFKRELTDAELVDYLSGKVPSDYVLKYPYIDNANDTGPNAIHGIVTGSPTFGFETL